MVPPGNLAGANHPGGKKEDALHAMRAQDGIGDGVVVQVSIVEGNQHAAAAALLFESAADEGQCLFQSDRRDAALQVGNLVAELFGGRREDAWVEKIVIGVADAMVIQDQKRIAGRKLREEESGATPEQPARHQLALSTAAPTAGHIHPIISGLRRRAKRPTRGQEACVLALREVLPALRVEGLGALRGEKRYGGPAGAESRDAADSGDGKAGDLAWQAGLRGGGKEEFIVFSAVEGLGQGCAGMNGKQSGIHLGGYSGLLAEVGEVGGEAVAEVDGGGGQTVPYEPEALIDAGLGVKVRGQQGFQLAGDSERLGWLAFSQLGKAGEGGGGSAKGACDVEELARAGGGAEQGPSLGNAADEDDVGDGDGRLGEIPAGQRGLVEIGRAS